MTDIKNKKPRKAKKKEKFFKFPSEEYKLLRLYDVSLRGTVLQPFKLIINAYEDGSWTMLNLDNMEKYLTRSLDFLKLKARYMHLYYVSNMKLYYDDNGFHIDDHTFHSLDEVDKALDNVAFL